MVNFISKEKYGVDDLVKIMDMLRSENGCPWDREQTHESIRRNFIEEVYEACEAIDLKDGELLKEELGDVLLQVVFHAQMAKEEASFDFDGVADGICKKLIVRHPHIFGGLKLKTGSADEVVGNWEDIKNSQKKDGSRAKAVEMVAKSLPALMRAEKVQGRAKRAGFELPDTEKAAGRASGILSELKNERDPGKARGLVGELLFAAVTISKNLDIDPEEALVGETENFIKNFSRNNL
jgi:tetrapyrrole methylase family protein/MazG family protein